MTRSTTVLLSTFFLFGIACGHAEDFNGSERPLPSSQVGNACDQDSDCSQYCAKGKEFPNGFCTLRNCRANTDCPEGTVCITEDNGVCVFPCGVPLDCTSDFLGRGGYTCKEKSGYPSADISSVKYKVCIGT